MTVRPLSQADVPIAARLAAVLAQLDHVVVGKSHPIRLALACMIARGHLLIEDIPGVGKSTLAQALATTLGLRYSRVQFTSDLLPADVLGVSIFDTHTQAFRFHPGPIFSSVVLADEINRAPPKTQSALLEAMEERQVSLDGQTRKLPDPFFVIATQNPVEQIGAYPLPESQLDRFLMAIELGYPDAAAERELLAGGDRRAQIPTLPALADPGTLLAWQREAAAIHVADAVSDYAVRLVRRTREERDVTVGASPRASRFLVRAAKARALLDGRDFATPFDVKRSAPDVLRHRIVLSYEAEADGVRPEGVVDAVLAAVETP